MKHHSLIYSLLLQVIWLSATGAAEEPIFIARTTAGKEVRGPLHAVAADWSVEIGKGVRHKIPAAKLLCLQQEGMALPPLPSDEHLILSNGDRLPVQDLRLDDEKFYFRHKTLGGDQQLWLPQSAVVLVWRSPPDRIVLPERFRRELYTAKRSRDRILLRNGDTLEGTLIAVEPGNAEIEVNKKTVTARWSQIAAIALNTELAGKLKPKGIHARLILSEADGSLGGRVTLASASYDGTTFRGKTAFGALVRIPLARIVALQILGGNADYLSDLKPAKYEYHPYLDEKWSWSADSNVLGRDMRLGGSTWDKGIGMHAHSSLTWKLDGTYKRFEALVGLDDLDGRKGKVRVRVLVDGKAIDLGKQDVLTHRDRPLPVSVPLVDARTLTLEVENTEEGLVQGVIDWANARLVK